MNSNTLQISKGYSRTLTKIRVYLLSTSIALLSASLSAQEKQWFFDIELIVYKRNITPEEVSEQFEPGLNQADTSNTFDLLGPIVQPDLNDIRQHLRDCSQPEKAATGLQLPEVIAASVFTPIEEPPIEVQIKQDSSASQGKDFLNEPAQVSEIDPATPEEALPTDEQTATAELATQGYSESVQEEILDIAPIAEYLTLPDWQPIDFIEQSGCAIAPQENRQILARSVPRHPQGKPIDTSTDAQLLASQDLQLNELAKSLSRQKGLTLLMHTGWRQEVLFGRNVGPAFRLYAGENFADEYAVDGTHIAIDEQNITEPTGSVVDTETLMPEKDYLAIGSQPEQDLIEQIKLALASPDPLAKNKNRITTEATEQEMTDYIWELDGRLQIFLRYINRTPYLHIDGNLDFRAPVFDDSITEQSADTGLKTHNQFTTPDRLQSYNFSQLRRVISTQLHYFDHPMFGLVMQIRRYDMPKAQDNESQE